MKKIRRIFAVLLSLAMVLGMSMTTFAAGSSESPFNSNITITNLAVDDNTTVNVFKAVYLNEDENEWVVADWAKDYITLDATNNKYTITNPAGLGTNVPEKPDYTEKTNETSITFEGVPVGAYVIIASGNKATYTTMVANTYKEDATYMESKDVSLIAKLDTYKVDKSANDNFVARGEEVIFTITTVFPNFSENPDSVKNTYKIVDTSTDLKILGVETATVGGENVLEEITASYTDETKGEYTIDLSDLIGTENINSGKPVIIAYKAEVLTDAGYQNAVNTFKNDTVTGKDDEKGYTGDVTLTKYAEDKKTALSGAEFKVGKKDGETVVEALYFVETSKGNYKLAKATEAGATQTVVVADDGTVKLTGLDEGTYHFIETKAPEGYSINKDGVDATIEKNDEAHVSIKAELTDTKLSSLPSTGGIGTTIFTIGGCLIMIVAAGLFFASRRKSAK